MALSWLTPARVAEVLAVILGLVYVLLIMRRNRWGWVAGAGSSLILIVLMARAHLPMQAGLNAFYVLMAVYGWVSWSRALSADGGAIRRWPWRWHLVAVGAIALLGLLSAGVLARETQAAWPLLDSLVAMTCLLASFMVAHSVLENWCYWIAADAITVYMLLQQQLPASALLYAAYLTIAIFGFRAWQLRYRQQSTNRPA